MGPRLEVLLKLQATLAHHGRQARKRWLVYYSILQTSRKLIQLTNTLLFMQVFFEGLF